MSHLKFVVIPAKDIYENYSNDIVSKIRNVKNCSSDLDKNYGDLLNSRISKHKKNNKNVITIGLSEVEHDTLMIHFNGIRPKTMEMDEFIALLESYDNEESEDDNDDDESSSSCSSDEDDESKTGNVLEESETENVLEESDSDDDSN